MISFLPLNPSLKVADQISDAILDAILAQDPKARVAAETLCNTGLVVLAGEITTTANVDYIHVAPPQYKGLWVKALAELDARPAWVNPDGVVVAQIDPKEYEPQTLQHLTLVDERKYGTTLLLFYERPGE